MRRLLLLTAAAALFASCGNSKPAGNADAGGDTGAGGALTACLDQPAELARPPAGRLPCELIPPGLHL